MQVLQPGEIPIINRTGGTIPGGSLARIAGRDSAATAFWEVAQPNAADQRNVCVVPEDLPDDAKGIGLLLDHPRVLKHSVGATLAAGDYLGAASGAWQAAAGNTLLVWSCNSTEATATFVGQPISAGTGIVVMDETLIGRIPSNQYSIDRLWFLDRYYAAQTAAPPVWRQVNMNLHLEAAGVGGGVAVGVPSPVFGKVVGLTVNCAQRTAHGAGVVDFIPYNATTGGGAPQADAPQLDNLDPLNPTTAGYGTVLSDGLAVSFGDLIELWCRCAAGDAGRNIDFNAEASFIIKEQTAYVITGDLTPDATGVVVRNGQFGGKSAFELIDGAYWLWWDSTGPAWVISTALGVTPGWTHASLTGNYDPPGAPPPTGTATVAAYPA